MGEESTLFCALYEKLLKYVLIYTFNRESGSKGPWLVLRALISILTERVGRLCRNLGRDYLPFRKFNAFLVIDRSGATTSSAPVCSDLPIARTD